jgi:predicted secreted protein
LSNAESINAKAGSTFEIKLPGMPTTGYVWELAQDPESSGLVALLDVHWDEGRDRAAGSPGLRVFRLKALSEGRASLVFQRRRPWEKKAAQEERVFSLTVEP